MKQVVDCKKYLLTNYCNKSKATNAYFEDVRRYVILTKEKENELLLKSKQSKGKEQIDAINSLINCNQRFVLSVALKYANDDNLLDLVSEGNIGLMEAIKRFDVDKDCKFITYAVWWIRKYIVNYLITKENIVIPPNAQKLYGKVSKIKNDFIQKEEREPTLNELKETVNEMTGLNIESAHVLEDVVAVSISNYSTDDTNRQNITQFDNITSTNNIEDNIELCDKKNMVEHLLTHLSERERNIVCYSYGIGCNQMTNICIADKLGLSTERVRQIRLSALKKLTKVINI